MAAQGVIDIAVVNRLHIDTVCSACRSQIDGDFVELAVTDSGSGIAPAIIDRIFDPFFSTKEVGKGSGMGLAIVQRITDWQGGKVFKK